MGEVRPDTASYAVLLDGSGKFASIVFCFEANSYEPGPSRMIRCLLLTKTVPVRLNPKQAKV
jgi:hypothetical protein